MRPPRSPCHPVPLYGRQRGADLCSQYPSLPLLVALFGGLVSGRNFSLKPLSLWRVVLAGCMWVWVTPSRSNPGQCIRCCILVEWSLYVTFAISSPPLCSILPQNFWKTSIRKEIFLKGSVQPELCTSNFHWLPWEIFGDLKSHLWLSLFFGSHVPHFFLSYLIFSYNQPCHSPPGLLGSG